MVDVEPNNEDVTDISRLADVEASTKGENALKMLCGPTTFALKFSNNTSGSRFSMGPPPRATPELMMSRSRLEVCLVMVAAAAWSSGERGPQSQCPLQQTPERSMTNAP